MYKKVNNNFNATNIEKEILKFWEDNCIVDTRNTLNQNNEEYVVYDGPPTANGKPHIGHILTRIVKDVMPRYHIMSGQHCVLKAGWDTHGLPVELEIEKKLNINGKQQIEAYGIDKFTKLCRESVLVYKNTWENMSKLVGYFADIEHPYITYDNNYIESVWWSLKEIYTKNLLYKDYKIVPYCSRCGTSLSSHEVAQGYKEVKTNSIYVKFELVDYPQTYFLVWTTTPWTLPSNVALCLNPNIEYAEIKVNNEKYILAKNLIDSLFTDYELINVKQGSEYLHIKYKPIISNIDISEYNQNNLYSVICDEFVSVDDGSGIVHIAPAFGEDDSIVGKKNNLECIKFVDDKGRLTKETGKYANMYVFDANEYIINDLIKENKLYKIQKITHTYPFCWRCDTPLLYYARHSWFIKVTSIKDKLIKNNNCINWMPSNIKLGRMGNFIDNVIDWGISRERYWGTPLPIWMCNECKSINVIGSIKELKEKCNIDDNEYIDLHRPHIDKYTFKCTCGGMFVREKEVLDCWYDSGSMPFAQLHYPFENKELFSKKFPADFISEAIDQTRGWFYTLLVISTILFDKAPFKNCIVLGHVNDKNGIKMSKHKGNVVDPFYILNKYGADSIRWYFYTCSALWIPNKFDENNIVESQKKFLNTLYNIYAFYVLYADIDMYDPSKYNINDCKLSILDLWILSKLNSLIQNVNENLQQYNILDSSRNIQAFINDLSNWYIRRSRERFWGSNFDDDKKSAFNTLYYVLNNVSKLIAPFVPYISEEIYQTITRPFFKNSELSVHFTKYPQADIKYIDISLENKMQNVLDIVILGRACRNISQIKTRQMLKNILICNNNNIKLNNEFINIIKDELNVADVVYIDDEYQYVNYCIKPNYKVLGVKYGNNINDVKNALNSIDANLYIKEVKNNQCINVVYNNHNYKFTIDELEVTSIGKDGYISSSNKDLTVILNTNLDNELIKKGIERELISKIQLLRKEYKFNVTDYITISYNTDDEIINNIIYNNNYIKKAVLAKDIFKIDNILNAHEIKVNNKICYIVLNIVK